MGYYILSRNYPVIDFALAAIEYKIIVDWTYLVIWLCMANVINYKKIAKFFKKYIK